MSGTKFRGGRQNRVQCAILILSWKDVETPRAEDSKLGVALGPLSLGVWRLRARAAQAQMHMYLHLHLHTHIQQTDWGAEQAWRRHLASRISQYTFNNKRRDRDTCVALSPPLEQIHACSSTPTTTIACASAYVVMCCLVRSCPRRCAVQHSELLS